MTSSAAFSGSSQGQATATSTNIETMPPSDISLAADDYRILRPGDFKRTKSQPSLRSRPVSRIVAPESPNPAASSSSSPSSSSNISFNPSAQAALPPPDLDLVIQSKPTQLVERENGKRDTFGPWQDDAIDSDAEDLAAQPSEFHEELLSVADDESVSGSMLAADGPISVDHSSTSVASSSSYSSLLDAHASQLKQEAEHVWANYRPGMTPPQQHLPLQKHKSRDVSVASLTRPPHIPQRSASLRRPSSRALKASSASISTVSSPSQASTAAFGPTPSSSNGHLETGTSPRLPSSFSHGSAATWAGTRSSDLRLPRPYTASILSSTSDSSFPSLQHSFESGMSPLLLNVSAPTSRTLASRPRPHTSGNLPNIYQGVAGLEHPRMTHASVNFARPDMSNQLSPEERRQQVRRQKKLTQLLGEEMLLAPTSIHAEPRSLTASSRPRRKQTRTQSMQFSPDTFTSSSASSNKTRTLSQMLLNSRSSRVKSLDRAFSDMMPPAASTPASLNRKAAAILGLPHPYSSNALARVSAEDVLASDEELDVLGELRSRPLIPSGLEEFNEPTPKVAQLAAFSAAALDEGDSPTLPDDGPFRVFRGQQLDQAPGTSESRKLAAARDERRCRVAKMSRWLGEAVPAELIQSGADQEQTAVIRSTGARASSQPASTENSHDSATYIASDGGSTHRSVHPRSVCSDSVVGHVSHDGSMAPKLRSFMSIDSSDEEDDDDDEVVREERTFESRSVEPSPLSIASGLPDIVSGYGYSVDSDEHLLEDRRQRLSELASILTDSRDTISSTSPFTRPQHSPVRARTSLSAHTFVTPSMASVDSPTSQHIHLPTPEPRPSAAFLDLSGSESDSTTDEPLDEFDELPRAQDRSLSKLSNFFGSTPAQIAEAGGALKGMLRSLEEEVLNEGWAQKEGRRGSGFRRRTRELFA